MTSRQVMTRGLTTLPPSIPPLNRVVWRPERSARDQRLARREQAHGAVNLRRFQRFFQRELRRNDRESFGEHRFARDQIHV